MDEHKVPEEAVLEGGAAADCGCGPRGCGQRPLARRDFIKIAGLGMLATSAGRPLTAMAGPFAAPDTPRHPVPGDKKLSPEWLRSLYERGTKEVFRGEALPAIGMPCGGIGSGQMYLCGDGTLGCWQIFNNAESLWVENTNATYLKREPAKPVFQRFAAAVRKPDGAWDARPLDSDAFPKTSFKGEYPVATVQYEGADLPVRVTLEAFSPFIPLNAPDSALPATLFRFTAGNPAAASAPIEVSLLGLLENPVALQSAPSFVATRRTRTLRESGLTLLVHSAEESPAFVERVEKGEKRAPVVFADFEGTDYGAWTVEGEAFGAGPVREALPGQHPVEGFQGDGLVNSFVGGDDPKGRLTSPEFVIERRFINFLIGGGNQEGKTCVNLLVDGETVRTARGAGTERLDWRSWNVTRLEGKTARIEIVDEAAGGWGHVNADHFLFEDEPKDGVDTRLAEMPDFGTLCLALAGDALAAGEAAVLAAGLALDGMPELLTAEDAEFSVEERRTGLLAARPVTLAPGESADFVFAVSWHFPNHSEDNPDKKQKEKVGHFYASRFADAGAVAGYLLENLDRLAGDTRLWRDLYYGATLPYWLLDRLLSTVSTLATGTCQWWASGRFYAYEGVTCCHGTCTHVWNYSHTEGRLFPELTRSVREMQDFCDNAQGGGFHPDTGLVGFRGNDKYAADGQCGTILKAYRDHLMSPDDAFLKRNWPRIRKALEYSIAQDENEDGIIENLQHNTFDIDFHGANTFVGSLYLCALRAAEEMAEEVGDVEFARRARKIRGRGRKATERRLWNGEYFIQEVDLKKHPRHQYADGCLSDQMFGQGWAEQLGLGYLYDRDKVRSALQAVWRYNWTPDISPYNKKYPPFRWFISPGQAGLITCTWPHGNYQKEGVLYREEVWTGIEYQVAGHLAAEGMLDEALSICRAVHDRYHPNLFNPYNEIECGDHYARAMASWGVYLALAGFHHHGPKGILGFAPRMTPEHFSAPFTTAEGWVVFSQDREGQVQRSRVDVKWGRLRLNELRLGLPGGMAPVSVKVGTADGQVPFADSVRDGMLILRFPGGLTLEKDGWVACAAVPARPNL